MKTLVVILLAVAGVGVFACTRDPKPVDKYAGCVVDRNDTRFEGWTVYRCFHPIREPGRTEQNGTLDIDRREVFYWSQSEEVTDLLAGRVARLQERAQ